MKVKGYSEVIEKLKQRRTATAIKTKQCKNKVQKYQERCMFEKEPGYIL